MPTHTDRPDPTAAELEATAELPVVDFGAAPEPGDLTATFSAAALPTLADSLRDVEASLKRKTERLRALEGQLEAAEAAEVALRADLDRERRAATEQLAVERRSSAELLERERAAIAQQLEHERRTSTAQLEAERKSATQRFDQLRQDTQAELAGVRSTAQGSAQELSQRLAASEQALQQTRAAYETTLGELAAVQGRLVEHERLVAELRESTARQANELRHQERDLGELRQRAGRQAEALTRSQGSQGVLESMLLAREQELAEGEALHATQIAATTAEAARQVQQAIERETSMREQTASTTAAMRREHERQLAKLVAQHSEREAAFTADRAASDTALKAEYESRETQTRTAHDASEQALTRELARLREESSQRIGALEESLQQRTTELADSRSRVESAERTVAEQSARIESAQAERQALRDELGILRTTDAASRAGVARFDEQRLQIEELERALGEAQHLAERLEADLAAARDSVKQLEADVRARASMLGNLQQNIARLGRDDTVAKPGLRLVGAGAALPERVLIGQRDGQNLMHALGRRTTIGRTADNQIQIETSHVSRHHAVILGSEQHCVIEDLNSTNGVFVNGKRVTRQALHDGDIVKIGQSVFRFRQTS